MKISDILQEENKFPLSSIEKAEIIRVGEVKQGASGQYQIITIKAPDGAKLTVMLYNNQHLLSTEEIGRMVSFKSGPPHNGKPTGLIVKKGEDGKVKVSVTDKAIQILHGNDIDDDDPEPQLTETKPQLYEENEERDTTQEEGPSDHVINECFHERLHILNILERLNQSYGEPFTRDALFPMVTSISIDASRAGKKILPLPTHTKKEKFAPIEKPHNDPRPSKPPTDTVDEPASEETEADFIVRFIQNNAKTIKALSFKSKSGKTLAEVMSEQDSRVKSMEHYLVRRAKPPEETTELYEALHEIFTELPDYLKNYVVYEAIYFNQVEIGNFEREAENIQEDEKANLIMSGIYDKFRHKAYDPKKSWQLYKNYYKSPVADRGPEPF